METELNSMWQKANVLQTPGQPLEDSLATIAMEISCPQTYSTFRTILMAADDKLTRGTHSALDAKTTGRSKGKGKGKVRKENKGQKSSTYCSKSGQTDDERWVKNATNRSKEKDDTLKEEMDQKELAAHVANMGSTHLPPLCLFVARQTSPTQRDWIVDSGTSAHTCRKQNQFGIYCALWSPHLTSLRNGKPSLH